MLLIKYVYSLVKSLTAGYSFCWEVANRRIRHNKKLLIPRVLDGEVRRRAFSYFSPVLYNGISDNIKQCNSSADFEAKIKGWLGINFQ